MDCMITHPSVLRAVLEYVFLARPAQVVLGDAPLQGCDFERMLDHGNLRAVVAKFQARVQAKGLEWDGWRARLSAATAKVEAAARQSSVMVDGYRAGAAAVEAQAGAYMRRWEADIKQYEAGTNITFQAAKINADAVMHANDARMEAAKVGLTSASQRLASAWAMVSASASISGSVSQTITG